MPDPCGQHLSPSFRLMPPKPQAHTCPVAPAAAQVWHLLLMIQGAVLQAQSQTALRLHACESEQFQQMARFGHPTMRALVQHGTAPQAWPVVLRLPPRLHAELRPDAGASCRVMFAFARDGGLPASRVWAYISPITQTPINAVCPAAAAAACTAPALSAGCCCWPGLSCSWTRSRAEHCIHHPGSAASSCSPGQPPAVCAACFGSCTCLAASSAHHCRCLLRTESEPASAATGVQKL